MFQNWNHRPGMMGNIARSFLGKDNVSAVITGVDEDVIHRLGITLKNIIQRWTHLQCWLHDKFMFILPCIVLQLSNVNQENSLFKWMFLFILLILYMFDQFFFLVSYMFRTSYVLHQEDVFVHAFLYVMFFMHLCKQSNRLEDDRAHPPSC